MQTLTSALAPMIETLHHLGQDRYRQLDLSYNDILSQTFLTLKTGPSVPAMPRILWLQQLTRAMAASCGATMANLGEIRNRLHLPTPQGFVIIASAYQSFLTDTGLSGQIETILH